MGMTGSTKRTPGRAWAYACAQLGGAVSIAANYAHSYVPPKDGPADWSPPGGAVAFSVFWPVALFFAIEAFARVPWPDGKRWVALRFMGLLPVALVAAVVSYVHLSDLLAHYGAGGFESTVGPLAVDGLMVIGTGALIATGQRRAAEPDAATGTPAPSPADVPAFDASLGKVTVTEPVPVAETPAVPEQTDAPVGTPPPPRTATAKRTRTGTATKGRTARKTGTRTDDELLAALADVPREPDGTVPVRRAVAALGTGPDRARRLLRDAGLLRTETTAEPPTESAARPANGASVPDLIDA